MGTQALEASKVYRGGVKARSLSFETSKIKISDTNGKLELSFIMSSKGGGNTEVNIEISPNDFGYIIKKMTESSRQRAMEIMSSELARHVKEQPKYDEALTMNARKSVQELAQKNYFSAPSDSRDAESFVFQSVIKLVKSLNTPDSAKL